MSQPHSKRRLTQSEGLALIAEYYKSGMGSSAFYRSHGLSEWTFYKFRNLYLQLYPEAASSAKAINHSPEVFQPIEITGLGESFKPLPALELRYPDGVVLHICAGLEDVGLLKDLLKQ